jgi:2-pyrone-4,6-dicarboxylate lactonase
MPILTQAPDPNPKMPKLALPQGSCDTRVHLFGPADKYPSAPDSPYISRDALAETYIALQDKLGLARAVIVSGGGYGRDYRRSPATLTAFAASRCCRKTRAPPSLRGSPTSACAGCA